ncbi:NAD(P)H-hydrate dehydratase [Christiangramia flava]|uniref:Bifunctional NAD(P)H-hydrate repair enzyme n=1 Tax=Christiangramia flava JLT2011 TaxID=1229726 RepID=A0A1L7I9N8_9FLAO|nr:NAD(P)H-hydrate dehydratase [Christiangramia flava]APU69913.1 NAD(P)HX epimerase [Christiangramia flava JLT2011]OSS37771.1 YjeF protein [Christiangramia flava JLT2011]
MKILSGKQISEADKYTIEHDGITSEELMERAGTLVFKQIHQRLQGAPIPIKIFCGIGNNGGDGLVIGRHLIQHGYDVKLYTVAYSDKRSEDFLKNYEKIKDITNDWPGLIKEVDDFPEISVGDFVIDAIFGVGLNRPIESWVAKLVTHINDSGAFTLAVDIPSGLFDDQPPQGSVIQANYTLTFGAPKLVFYLPDTMDYAGEVQVLDIGLNKRFIAGIDSRTYLIGKQEAPALYQPRNKNSHKGDYGNILIAGGSYGKIGSVLLSATAAMHTGSGLCTLYVPKCGYEIIQSSLPEAMVLTDENEQKLSDFPIDFEADTIGFGMGAGTENESITAFEKLLQNQKKPILVDADGLNMLSKKPELLKLLPENSVLTPHPGELKRLIGEWENDFEKLEKARNFSKKFNVILVIKGAYTFILQNEELFINTSGNPGMATAGSGDVLSGVITSLMGQNYQPVAASILGVFIHGLSGDLVASAQGYEGVTSGEMARNMGKAFQYLFQKEIKTGGKE